MPWIHGIQYIFFIIQNLEQLALALKNRVCPEFAALIFFIVQNFEQLALALKNRVGPELFKPGGMPPPTSYATTSTDPKQPLLLQCQSHLRTCLFALLIGLLPMSLLNCCPSRVFHKYKHLRLVWYHSYWFQHLSKVILRLFPITSIFQHSTEWVNLLAKNKRWYTEIENMAIFDIEKYLSQSELIWLWSKCMKIVLPLTIKAMNLRLCSMISCR